MKRRLQVGLGEEAFHNVRERLGPERLVASRPGIWASI
jgi:hypothetical protein